MVGSYVKLRQGGWNWRSLPLGRCQDFINDLFHGTARRTVSASRAASVADQVIASTAVGTVSLSVWVHNNHCIAVRAGIGWGFEEASTGTGRKASSNHQRIWYRVRCAVVQKEVALI